MPKRKPTISSSTDLAPTSNSDGTPLPLPPSLRAAPKPPPGVTVLTAELAAVLIESMANKSADRCALCNVPFSGAIPSEPAMFGPYKAHLCHECKVRYGNYRVVG